jgi:hypothetical protein
MNQRLAIINTGIIFLALLMVADGVTTLYGFSTGIASEANPLVSATMKLVGVYWAIVIFKLACLAMCGMLYGMREMFAVSSVRMTALAALVAVYGYAVTSNIGIILS